MGGEFALDAGVNREAEASHHSRTCRCKHQHRPRRAPRTGETCVVAVHPCLPCLVCTSKQMHVDKDPFPSKWHGASPPHRCHQGPRHTGVGRKGGLDGQMVGSEGRLGPEGLERMGKEHDQVQRRETKQERIRRTMSGSVQASLEIRPEDYVVVDGLRIVLPYDFEFQCHVKKRWIGRSVVDVFVEEFRGRDRSYFEKALRTGRLVVQGREPGADSPLKQSEVIRHFIHRHEPPVLEETIHIVHCTEDMVVVSKPACMPVHATGQYRKNTVLGILEAQAPHLMPLLPVHRLDNQVSGLLIFARNKAMATKLGKQIESRQITKVYLARVGGIFPREESVVDCPLKYDHRNGIAVNASDLPEQEGKPAKTIFHRIRVSHDETYSIVVCRPITGRSHQIRIHLRETGHPIQNDPLYGGSKSMNRVALGLEEAMTLQLDDVDKINSGREEVGAESCKKRKTCARREGTCMHCPHLLPRGYPLKLEPLWLHAHSYAGEGWSFQSPTPAWVEQD